MRLWAQIKIHPPAFVATVMNFMYPLPADKIVNKYILTYRAIRQSVALPLNLRV